MVAVVLKEFGELVAERWWVFLGEGRVPGRIFDPDEHAHFVGQFEVALRGNPEAELHQVKALRPDQLELCAPGGLARVGRKQRRRIAPVENAADAERLAIEPEFLAVSFQRPESGDGSDGVAVLAGQRDLNLVETWPRRGPQSGLGHDYTGLESVV